MSAARSTARASRRATLREDSALIERAVSAQNLIAAPWETAEQRLV